MATVTEREIRLWNRQREGIRTQCTAEIHTSRQYLDPNIEVTSPQLQSSITVLKEVRNKLTKLDNDILLHIEDDVEAENEVATATTYDFDLLKIISDLSAKLEVVLSVSVASNIQNSAATASERPNSPIGSFATGSNRRGLSVYLPKIQITKFGGDPMKWTEFWDNFSSTIHENEDLPEIEKFKYLQSFLTGDALRVIAGYRLTSANYTHAVEELTERYGNEQLTVFSHFKAMIELPPSTHDTEKLQSIYDECEKHIRSLVALGRNEETFGEVFTPLILSKLPSYVKMELYRRTGSQPWELSNLRTWLKEEIRARDYSQRTFGSTSDSNRNKDKYSSKPRQHGTSSALVTHEKSSSSSLKVKCVYCDGSHYPDQCEKFPDVQSRKACLVGRCFCCLSKEHSAKNCSDRPKCFHCGRNSHHRSLCYNKFSTASSQSRSSQQVSDSSAMIQPSEPEEHSSLLSHGETSILQTAVCSVEGKQSIASARMLFDTACSRTFITREMCNRIGARSLGKARISIARFKSEKRTTEEYDTVEFDVVLRDGDHKTLVANVTDRITAPIQKIPLDTKLNPTLRTMSLAEPLVSVREHVEVDILLGADYYYEFIGSTQLKLKGGLILLSSSLGLVATGRVKSSNLSDNSLVTTLNVSVSPESTLHIEKFWSLEDIGVKSPTELSGDEEAMNTFKKTVKFEDGRYQIQLPYKSDAKELPENRNQAYACLVSQLKRLKSDKDILKKYDDIIQDQLSKGIIEVTPDKPTGPKVHYLPHHCVVTPNKATTKVRIVYNASAKSGKSSASLNECLNRGPVILDDLCGLLIKFRLHSIGLVSDLEKAFLQVGLQECDRDVTRFFWIKDLDKPPTGDNLVVLRFCRVLFGAISSPFLLGATIEFHLDNSKKSVASDIKGHVYVDNVINGKRSADEAITFYKEAKQLFNDASMNLREWFTNSEVVRKEIKDVDQGGSTSTKVLGMKWDTDSDMLSCGSFVVQEDAINTKGLMLKYLAKVFDPCGYFSAITVTGKLLIQKLWQSKYDWDDVVSDDIAAEWKNCCDSLQKIGSHPISRCYNHEIGAAGTSYDLHCFCDASGKAYAAVVYLVVTTSKGSSSDIVFAKTRVAPIKPLTIPRMELMAVVVGVRIMSFVESAIDLPIANKYVWSDSKCVLHWLFKSSIDTVFVRNRVTEINSHKDVQFRYVPTDVNPADLSSRGCSFETLTESKLWWNGPSWLTSNDSKWPENIPMPVLDVQHDEPTPESNDVVNIAADNIQEPIVEVERFSSLKRLLRVSAWVQRFIDNARKKGKLTGPLTASEIAKAQVYWNHRAQQAHFGRIFSTKDAKSKNLVRQLDLFADDQDLIRCGGRLKEANVDYDTKHPILLPKHCHYTDLVIKDCHSRIFHVGVTHTLSELRQKYWIIHGRNQVKRVIHRCHVCKIVQQGPYRYPNPPSLPGFRVNREKPFAAVGIDYMGPLLIKDPSSDELSKVWICLFTCAITRAIHLEVIDDLSARQFLLCLRRFVAFYGKPKIIVSDNAKHFHRTNKHLAKIWSELKKDDRIQDWSSSQGIEWKFIVELSPWMGGFYERMVGIVKVTLKKSLDVRYVSKTELQTVLAEVAGIVNSRPLVHLDSDSVTTPTTLTPSHFLGGPHSNLPNVCVETDNFEPKNQPDHLVAMWNNINKILNDFWLQWRNQYLLGLREKSYSVKQRNASSLKPCIGDVVIVKDNLPRKYWRIGRITSLPTSRDGNIRSAVVMLANKKSINRPLKLLFPLETNTNGNNCTVDGPTNDTLEQRKQSGLPRREAFKKAKEKIKNVAFSDRSDEGSDTNE